MIASAPAAIQQEEAATASESPSLRRLIVARALGEVTHRLRAEGRSLQHAALDALRRALAEGAPASSPAGAGSDAPEQQYTAGHRLVALTLSPPLYAAVAALARTSFKGDLPAAAGWLLARGAGLSLALPGAAAPETSLRARPRPATLRRGLDSDPDPTSARSLAPRPQSPRAAPPRARVSSDIDAPGADQLRDLRERLGLSQKEVATAAGLSRGLVAEVERGRRQNALTRLRIAETLAALARAA